MCRIDMAAWDRCIDPHARPLIANRTLSVWVGIDASVKHDSTAIAVVTFDTQAQQCRLVWHRIFQPSPDQPLNFEATIEATLFELAQRFVIRKVLFDPFQTVASAQRLQRELIPIEEFPQTVPNLTAASQNLYELVTAGNFSAYPDATIRLAIQRAVAIETPRGWRIAKDKQSHKIDVVVALAMAALAAVRAQSEYDYDESGRWMTGDVPTTPDDMAKWRWRTHWAQYGVT